MEIRTYWCFYSQIICTNWYYRHSSSSEFAHVYLIWKWPQCIKSATLTYTRGILCFHSFICMILNKRGVIAGGLMEIKWWRIKYKALITWSRASSSNRSLTQLDEEQLQHASFNKIVRLDILAEIAVRPFDKSNSVTFF